MSKRKEDPEGRPYPYQMYPPPPGTKSASSGERRTIVPPPSRSHYPPSYYSSYPPPSSTPPPYSASESSYGQYPGPPPPPSSTYYSNYPPGYYSSGYSSYGDHYGSSSPHNPPGHAPPYGGYSASYEVPSKKLKKTPAVHPPPSSHREPREPHRPPTDSSGAVYLLRSERFNGTFTPSGTPFDGVLEGAPELGFVVDLSIFGQNYKGFVLNANEYHHPLPPPKRDTAPGGGSYGSNNLFTRPEIEDLEEVIDGGRRMIYDAAKPPPPSYSLPTARREEGLPSTHLPPPSSYPAPSKLPVPVQRSYAEPPSLEERVMEKNRLPPPERLREPERARERSSDRERTPTGYMDSDNELVQPKHWICYFENCKQRFDNNEKFSEHIRKVHQNYPPSNNIDLTGPTSPSPSPVNGVSSRPHHFDRSYLPP